MKKQYIVAKTASATGLAALVEEHMEMFQGATRFAEILESALDATTWNYLANMLAADIVAAQQGGVS